MVWTLPHVLGYSSPSSRPSPSVRGRGWGWPPYSESFARAAARCGCAAVPAKARHSASTCPSYRPRRCRPPPCARRLAGSAAAAPCSWSRTKPRCGSSPVGSWHPTAISAWRRANGVEALDIMRERGDTIGAVVTDVVMPRLGGGALARAVGRAAANTAGALHERVQRRGRGASRTDPGRCAFPAETVHSGGAGCEAADPLRERSLS